MQYQQWRRDAKKGNTTIGRMRASVRTKPHHQDRTDEAEDNRIDPGLQKMGFQVEWAETNSIEIDWVC